MFKEISYSFQIKLFRNHGALVNCFYSKIIKSNLYKNMYTGLALNLPKTKTNDRMEIVHFCDNENHHISAEIYAVDLTIHRELNIS